MKKGFTLVELLAVLVILSVVALLTIPAVSESINYAKTESYNANIDAIKKAASDWALLNTKLLPKDGGSILVYLGELKKIGSVDMNIKNPATGRYLSNNTSVTITKHDGEFTFDVNLVEITTVDTSNPPLLVIDGNVVDYVEVNQLGIPYVVPEAHLVDASGSAPTQISYSIFKTGENEPVTAVDTSSIGSYRIIYTVTVGANQGNYEKTVMVVDTQSPDIEIEYNITCQVDTIPANLLDGIIVTDNSGEVIIPVVDSKIQNRKGQYYVYYTATDSSGNEITKRREVIVNE